MKVARSLRCTGGYSLIEMLMVVLFIGILGAMATFQIGNVREGMQGDGAMRLIMGQLNGAREQAIAHRRQVQVEFLGGNRLRLTRIEVPNGTTVLIDVPFESSVQFGQLPNTADTPDAFGNGTAVTFVPTAKFNTDGALIDSSGSPINGTVFLMIPGAPLSYRAVTVLGSTGRVRGYRWTGTQWMRV